MFIQTLKIHNFRNIKINEFNFERNINIFYGNNGVGKTSILEAIYFLSAGKSFRKGNFKNLINHTASSLTVYLKCLDKYSINPNDEIFAVCKHRNGQWQAKNNNTKILNQSNIAKLLPVIAIDPEVYRLLDFGPLHRRNFLDMLVFHVEHDYLLLWKKVYKCIKQLNTLFKTKASNVEIDLWENLLINFTEKLTHSRKKIFDKISPIIQSLCHFLQTDLDQLNLSFKRGWSDDLDFKQQLSQDRVNNLKYGQLFHGPHKMDIKVNIGTQSAADILSRGQKKILSIIFYMSFVELLLTNTDKKPIVCLDDFDAEIDLDNLATVASFFKEKEIQLFITSVHQDKLSHVFPEASLFHVKH